MRLPPLRDRVNAKRRATRIVNSLSGEDLLGLAEKYLDQSRTNIYYSRRTGNFILVNNTRPLHVSHLVSLLASGRIHRVLVIGELEMKRILAGVIYHSLLTGPIKKIGGVPEFQLPVLVNGQVVLATFDALIPSSTGYYIVEFKSTDNPITVNRGVLQVKLYVTLARMAGLRVEAGILQGITTRRIITTSFNPGRIQELIESVNNAPPRRRVKCEC